MMIRTHRQLRDARPGDMVYSSFHRANVIVLNRVDEPQFGNIPPCIKLHTAGYGAPHHHYSPVRPDAPMMYHTCIKNHGSAGSTWDKYHESGRDVDASLMLLATRRQSRPGYRNQLVLEAAGCER